jgi:hypothetical protein
LRHRRSADLRSVIVATAIVATALGGSPAFAAQRTFVASTGGDANPCTLVLPCRAFAAATLLTDPNGEIVVLDSAGYGPVTVTKPVSIIAPPGVYAGISVPSGQDGIVVNAAASDKVVLRGLAINGQGGNRGILVSAAGQVHVENCVVSNMAGDGILVNGGTSVYVAGSTLRSNNGSGLHLTGTTTEVHVDRARIANNIGKGILQEAGSLTVDGSSIENNGSSGIEVNPAAASTVVAALRASVVTGNAIAGIQALATAAGRVVHVAADGVGSLRNGSSGFVANSSSVGNVTLVIGASSATENGGNGVFATGLGTIVSVSASTVSRNAAAGLSQANNAELRSHGNNAVNGNVGVTETSGSITAIGQM